jgi:mono/diheme cytochrome c family protein
MTSRGMAASVVVACAIGATAIGGGAQTPAPAGSVGPRPNVGPADRPLVSPAAVARGRVVWSAECASCHGPTARGSDGVPSLLRSLLILSDRRGSELGPFLRKGHPMASGRPSGGLTEADIGDIMQFVRQRINDTLRGSPVFEPGDIVTGDVGAGRAYFAGAGGCTACHSATGDLAHIGSKYGNPVDLQQRMLFPVASRFGSRGGGPNRTAIRVTVTPHTGAPMTGVLVEEDDFFVSLRDDSGVVRTVRRSPTLEVVIDDPLREHHDWLGRVSDTNIHDLVAYLVTLK